MSAKWVGNGPVTNTSGGTGAEKGAARWTEPRRRVFMRSAESDWALVSDINWSSHHDYENHLDLFFVLSLIQISGFCQ